MDAPADLLRFLRDVRLFTRFGEPDLIALAESLHERHLRKNQVPAAKSAKVAPKSRTTSGTIRGCATAGIHCGAPRSTTASKASLP